METIKWFSFSFRERTLQFVSPLWDHQMSWTEFFCLLFENFGKFWKFFLTFWKRIGKLEFGIEIEFNLNLNWIGRFLKYFYKQWLRFPLLFDNSIGGFFIVNIDTRRCFLWCLQVSIICPTLCFGLPLGLWTFQ